jgi:hypothetical protein
MKIEKPDIYVVKNEEWTKEKNIESILSAAGVCKKTSPSNYYDFIKKHIINKKEEERHLKILEHSYVEFCLYNKNSVYKIDNIGFSANICICSPVSYFKKVSMRSGGDVFRSIYSLLSGECDYVYYFGSLRDLLEWSDIFNFNELLSEYGLESLSSFNGKSLIDFSDYDIFYSNNSKDVFQIKIKTNRFTAMQLRTHQSISWLIESTRAVEYNNCNSFSICSISDLGIIEKIGSCLGLVFSKLLKFLNCIPRITNKKIFNFKRQDRQRFLTEYRTTNIIGFAKKDYWDILCRKRMTKEAQHDIRHISEMIYNEINK